MTVTTQPANSLDVWEVLARRFVPGQPVVFRACAGLRRFGRPTAAYVFRAAHGFEVRVDAAWLADANPLEQLLVGLHELAHVALHLSDAPAWSIDPAFPYGLEGPDVDPEQEAQADAQAAMWFVELAREVT